MTEALYPRMYGEAQPKQLKGVSNVNEGSHAERIPSGVIGFI